MVIAKELELVSEKCLALGIKPSVRLLLVSVETQTLRWYDNGTLRKAFTISTSKKPPSNISGSLGTPTGLHAIAEKIGAGSPPGIVFRGRKSTGFHFREFSAPEAAGNLITSRILWLRGLEPGLNQGGQVDTYDRYIYIHGTNHEERLGSPMSAGCVEMSNLEVIELFEEMRVGDQVWIS